MEIEPGDRLRFPTLDAHHGVSDLLELDEVAWLECRADVADLASGAEAVDVGIRPPGPRYVLDTEDGLLAVPQHQSGPLFLLIHLDDERAYTGPIVPWASTGGFGELRQKLRPLVPGDGPDRAAIPPTPVVCPQTLPYSLVSRLLMLRLQRRPDLQASGQHLVRPKTLDEVASDLLSEVRGALPQLFDLALGEDPRFFEGLQSLLRRDVPLLEQASQYETLAALRGLRVLKRGVAGRGRNETGDQCGFPDAQFVDRLCVVGLRGCLDAVGPRAEVDLVEVEVEDLVLVEVVLDPLGQDHVFDLAEQSAFRAE